MKFEDFVAGKDNSILDPVKSGSSLEPNSVPKHDTMELKKQKFIEKESVLYNQDKFYDTNMNLSVLQQNLGNCLKIIDDEVMKGYINNLNRLPIIKPDAEIISLLKNIMFFKITGLVYQEEEFSVYKLSTMFHSLSNKPCTLVLMIKSDGNRNDFYLGVRSHKCELKQKMHKTRLSDTFNKKLLK